MNFTDFNNTSYVESIEYNGYEKLHENNTSFLLKNNISNKILTNSSLKTTSNLTNVLSYHDPSYRIIGTIIMTIIFLIGVVGNIMVILVVLKSKNMRSPTNCYLVSLAFADLLLLLSATLPTIVEFHLIQDEFVAGSIACRAMVFLQYLGFNLSSLSITALTAERYVAICRPMKAHVVCTINRAKKIIAVLWLFGLCYSAPWLALITTKKRYEGFDECTFTLGRDQYMIYYLTDLVVMYFIPVIVNVILYTFISKTLYYSNPISIAFGGGSTNTFGVVAATASICRTNGSYDNNNKFGSYKGSSINSSFQSYKNNENRSLIRKRFANESIKSFTLHRHESRNKKHAGNFKKKFLKKENSIFSRSKDSFDSNRICEGVEENENNPSVKEDKNKANEPNEHIKLNNKLNEKSIEFQNFDKNEFELDDLAVEENAENIAESSAKKDLSSKRQLKRQETLFHETLNQQNIRDTLDVKNTSEDLNLPSVSTPHNNTNTSDNSKLSFLLEKLNISIKLPRISSTNTSTTTSTISTTTSTTTATTAKKSSLHQPSTKSTKSTASSINSKRGRFKTSNSIGNSLKRKTTKTSLVSNMASSLSTASTYGSNPIHSRTQIIKMLVVVVSLFAVLWLPYRVYVVYNSFKKPRFEDVWLMLACRTMVHANSAINPILYNAMSVKFKKAFKSLLRCSNTATTNAPARRGAVDGNLNYSRKDIFFNMYEKNYREMIQDRAKTLRG